MNLDDEQFICWYEKHAQLIVGSKDIELKDVFRKLYGIDDEVYGVLESRYNGIVENPVPAK